LSAFSVLNTNDSGPGSLRQAILDANAQPGMNTVRFNIGSGAQTIHVGSDGFGGLPSITSPVILDGTTQPGFAGSPLIELDGTNAGPTDGLDILAGNSTVRALVINRFQGSAVALYYTGSGSRIEGNYLGTDLSGTFALGNGVAGVSIYGSTDNMIGGTTPARRNIISGNGAGVADYGGSANVVAGNYIGTDVSGSNALGNADGVDVSSAFGDRIGGSGPFQGNVISADRIGIDLFGGSTSTSVRQLHRHGRQWRRVPWESVDWRRDRGRGLEQSDWVRGSGRRRQRHLRQWPGRRPHSRNRRQLQHGRRQPDRHGRNRFPQPTQRVPGRRNLPGSG
jgi:hypothetical protein